MSDEVIHPKQLAFQIRAGENPLELVIHIQAESMFTCRDCLGDMLKEFVDKITDNDFRSYLNSSITTGDIVH